MCLDLSTIRNTIAALLCDFSLRAGGSREKLPKKAKQGKQLMEAGGKAVQVALDIEKDMPSTSWPAWHLHFG
jgi:hypothetical protein